METITAAAIQLSPGEDINNNLERAVDLIKSAAGDGAVFIALPEYFAYYGDENRWAEVAEKARLIKDTLSQQARALDSYILAGTVLTPSPRSGKLMNMSILFGPDGEQKATYVKRHLFDVDLETGKFCESDWLEPGGKMATAQAEGWTIGMSICFDLRFPQHFQKLRKMGAQMISAPSAFSMETGQAHWLTLIRARAIETQCYVIAPALWGPCGVGKRCFGSTAIIGPWGEVAAIKERDEGYVTAICGLSDVSRARRKIPLGFS